MPKDAIQSNFDVGDTINVVITVTAIGGTTAQPTVTGTTKYKGFDGNADTIGPIDCNQVIVEK